MSSKHTPGPWFTKREGFSTVYVEARLRGSTIQEVAACGPTEAGPEQQGANARLIAAAPELHAAVAAVIDATRDYLPPDGISKEEFINRVITATDNARMAEIMK